MAIPVLIGCPVEKRTAPPLTPLPHRLSWEGRPPSDWIVDSVVSATDPAFPATGIARHTLTFPGGDTVHLVEFRRDFQAYRAFQAQAVSEEIRQGFYRSDSSLHFFHGPYLGTVHLSGPGLVPSSYLQERLSIQGEERFRRPRVFESFPVSGQIEYTERVVSPEFLGPGGQEEVFLMRYKCWGDTAVLFRGFSASQDHVQSWLRAWEGTVDTLKWSRDMRFSGFTELEHPLEFWIFKGGYVGVEGCFDTVLAQEYAEKLRKMTVLLGNP
jgi:hypothetical protein